MNIELNIKQTQAIEYLEDNKTEVVLYGGAGGGGKSFLGCWWQFKNRVKYPGTRGIIARSVLKWLKESTLQTFFEVLAAANVPPEAYKYNSQEGIIKLWNGSSILLKDLEYSPRDPEYQRFGSIEATDAFIDEAGEVDGKAVEILKTRLRYKLDEYGLSPKLLMSCNPSKNFLYNEYYKPFRSGTLPGDKKFVQALIEDNSDNLSEHYIKLMDGLTGISRKRLRLGMWEYDSSPLDLFKYDAVQDVFSNTFVEPGSKYITADIARFGQDKTVIMIWDGWRCIRIKEMSSSSVIESAAAILNLSKEYRIPLSKIIVDEDGVGGGVKDILKCKGFVNNSRPIRTGATLENFSNLKAQCCFYLADIVEESKLFIDCKDPDLKAYISGEFEVVRQKGVGDDKKKAVISKDDMKKVLGRSPDYFDAVMMRAYFDVKPNFSMTM
jgi:hypothetical protein